MRRKLSLLEFNHVSESIQAEDLTFLMSLYVVYHKHCKIVTHRYHRLRLINSLINGVTAASVLTMSGLAVFLPPVIAVGNGVVITIRMAIARLGLVDKEAKCKVLLKTIKTLLSTIKMRLRSGSNEKMTQSERDAFSNTARSIDMATDLKETEIMWYRERYEVPASDIEETLKVKYPSMCLEMSL